MEHMHRLELRQMPHTLLVALCRVSFPNAACIPRRILEQRNNDDAWVQWVCACSTFIVWSHGVHGSHDGHGGHGTADDVYPT